MAISHFNSLRKAIMGKENLRQSKHITVRMLSPHWYHTTWFLETYER